MKSRDMEAWGRHYDMLLWTVTTIMAAAIGGLLVYNVGHFSIWLAVSGFILTIIAVYFAASFRELRHKVEEYYINEEIKEALSNRKFYQWPAYLLIFIILEALWIKLLIENRQDLLWVWIVIGSAGIGLIIYWGYKSQGKKK